MPCLAAAGTLTPSLLHSFALSLTHPHALAIHLCVVCGFDLVNPEGLTEEEALQLAMQASLAEQKQPNPGSRPNQQQQQQQQRQQQQQEQEQEQKGGGCVMS